MRSLIFFFMTLSGLGAFSPCLGASIGLRLCFCLTWHQSCSHTRYHCVIASVILYVTCILYSLRREEVLFLTFPLVLSTAYWPLTPDHSSSLLLARPALPLVHSSQPLFPRRGRTPRGCFIVLPAHVVLHHKESCTCHHSSLVSLRPYRVVTISFTPRTTPSTRSRSTSYSSKINTADASRLSDPTRGASTPRARLNPGRCLKGSNYNRPPPTRHHQTESPNAVIGPYWNSSEPSSSPKTSRSTYGRRQLTTSPMSATWSLTRPA